MGEVSTIGVDIAKSVFQVHGVDADGTVVIRRRVGRAKILEFFSKLRPCLVRDSPDDSKLTQIFGLFRPCSKTDARCGWLPAARAARTMVEQLIWLFSLASGRIPPVDCS